MAQTTREGPPVIIPPGEELVIERLELFAGELDGQVRVIKKTLHLV